MAHTLYRMFDRSRVLLYVGISKRPMTRFDEVTGWRPAPLQDSMPLRMIKQLAMARDGATC